MVQPGQFIGLGQPALAREPVRYRPGREHDLVGAERCNVLLVHRREVLYLDAELFQLAQVPAHQLGDLAAPRREAGETELAAEIAERFGEGDIVAALGGDARGFHAGGSAADYENFAGLGGLAEAITAPFEFTSGGRVDQA